MSSIINFTPLVQFRKVSFFYVNQDAPTTPATPAELSTEDVNFIFRELDLDLPPGVLSIVGENGIGKSTLMLLASARLFPVAGSGTIKLFNKNTSQWHQAANDPALEAERNALASIVYQNMEFESQDNIGGLIEQVFAMGRHTEQDDWVIEESQEVLELRGLMNRSFQQLSKGEMQRALIALALAYGSSLTIMDEPVFAMEEYQKDRTMEYLQDYSHRSQRHLYFSAHNIHLCQKYADNTLLMRKDGNFVLGSPQEVCTREELEAAYQVPMDVLHRREQLYRDMLIRRS